MAAPTSQATPESERLHLKRECFFLPAPSADTPNTGVDTLFRLYGDSGVLTFTLHTGWTKSVIAPPDCPTDFLNTSLAWSQCKPPYNCAFIEYHWKRPLVPGQEDMFEECPFFEGISYYHSSYINAFGFLASLIHGGSEGLWTALTRHYLEKS